MDKLGDKIRSLRKSRKLTQLKLASKIGVDPQQVSRWERNESSPTLENLTELAKFFQIDSQWLIGLKLKGEKGDKLADPIEPPYKSWDEWLTKLAPEDLTVDERIMLGILRFSGEPEPWRYTNILEQLRGPIRKETNDQGPITTIRKRR